MAGLTIEQFWGLTWKEWTIYQAAFVRKELNEWQRTRRVAYMVYLMGSGEKTKKEEHVFHPLASDEIDRGKPMSNEDVKRALQLYGK